MNKKGEIAYKEDGGVYELEPRDEDSYEYNGDKYEYEVECVRTAERIILHVFLAPNGPRKGSIGVLVAPILS